MSGGHSFQVDNLRQYVEFVENKTNQLCQLVFSLTQEVTKLKRVVTKLKNGEEVEDDAEDMPTNTVPSHAPKMMPPQMPNQFNQMPHLQTLNLGSAGNSRIDN